MQNSELKKQVVSTPNKIHRLVCHPFNHFHIYGGGCKVRDRCGFEAREGHRPSPTKCTIYLRKNNAITYHLTTILN